MWFHDKNAFKIKEEILLFFNSPHNTKYLQLLQCTGNIFTGYINVNKLCII